MQFKITGLENFKNSVLRSRARLKENVTHRYQMLVTDILKSLVRSTPQWSGDLAASWEVQAGKGNQGSKQGGYTSLKTVPFEFPRPVAGDSLGYALTANAEALKAIRWNSYVSIQNHSPTLSTGDNGNNPYGSKANPFADNSRPQDIGGFQAEIALIAAKYSYKGMKLSGGGL